jgi:hypothetical protein
MDAYLAQASQVKVVSDPAALDPLFLRRETRRVRHDAVNAQVKRALRGCLVFKLLG